MSEFQRIPSCPTCGKPLPCILHDRRTREALLAPEDEKPGFERTRIWKLSNLSPKKIVPFSDGRVLVYDGNKIIVFNPSRSDDKGRVFDVDIMEFESLGNGKILARGIGERPFSIIDFSKSSPSTKLLEIRERPGVSHRMLAGLSDDIALVSREDSNQGRGRSGIFQRDIAVIDCTKPDDPIVVPIPFASVPVIVERMTDTKAIVMSQNQEVYEVSYENGHSDVALLNRNIGPNRFVSIFSVSERHYLTSDVNGKLTLFEKKGDSITEKRSIGTVGSQLLTATREINGKVFFHTVNGMLASMDLHEPTPAIVTVTGTGVRGPVVTSLSESQVLIGSSDGVELWEIPEAKLRAYHDRQAAFADDEEIPELPYV